MPLLAPLAFIEGELPNELSEGVISNVCSEALKLKLPWVLSALVYYWEIAIGANGILYIRSHEQ